MNILPYRSPTLNPRRLNSLQEVKERLALDGPSPERRAQIEKEAAKHRNPHSVLVPITGPIPPKSKSARRKARKRRVAERWATSQHGPVTIHKPTSVPKEEQPRYAPGWLRKLVYDRDAGQCQYCGNEVSMEECNIDHVIPWPEGATTANNTVVACRECNKLKMKQWIPIYLRPIPGEVTTK